MKPIDINSDGETFFHLLLEETKELYKTSDVINKNSGWSYSMCGTPIVKKQGLILGLNWGGGGTGELFNPQAKYPDGDEIKTYPFIIKLTPYLKDHLGLEDITKINYSNLCFFRSPKVQDLSEKDWEVSIPLIQSYIKYVDPTWIVLTSSNVDRAKKPLLLDSTELFTAGVGRIYTGYKK